MRFHCLRTLPITLLILTACLMLQAVLPAQTDGQIIVQTVGPRTTFTIAVPEFQVEGAQRLPGEDFSAIVMNDLRLSGFFSPPENAGFANETHRADLAGGTINFAEWNRIGVAFLVRGKYSIEGGKVMVEVRTYDTVSRNYVFGKRYPATDLNDARWLAHLISDDILERLLAVQGNSRTRIAYVRQVDPFGKTKQICVADSDGRNEIVLTGDGELTATPAWGKFGGELYYTTYKDHNPDLAGVILATRQSWWISRRTGFNLSPAWNPVRERIALTLTKDGNSELYTIARDGSDLQRLTNNRAIDSSPTWSPDGRQIAFTSDRTGSPQIWIKDLGTGEERRLTYHSTYNDGASWAPAGPERIAFCSRVDGYFQIFVCNVDGSNLQQLTHGNHNNEDPCWSPNGLELMFTSDRTGRKQIYRMFGDGSNVNQITEGTACQSVAWSPVLP